MRFFINKYLFVFFIYFSNYAYCQYIVKDSIPFDYSTISQFQINDLNEFYFIANEKELIKIDSKNKVLQFPLTKLVSHLDTQLSLRTAVVYNYQEIEILDDKLNPIQDPINLNVYGIFPSAIALSDSQLLWYFDPIEMRLVQWNYQLKKIINKSNTLQLKPEDSVIQNIYQIKNRVFLKGENWVYEYDIFGNLKSNIQLPNHVSYLYNNSYINLYSETQIISINLLNQEISTSDNFFLGKDFTMNKDQLFVIKDKVMYIYTRIKK